MHVSPENGQLDPRDGPRPQINSRGPLNDGMVENFKMSAEALPSTIELCDAKAASIRPERQDQGVSLIPALMDR